MRILILIVTLIMFYSPGNASTTNSRGETTTAAIVHGSI